MCLIILKGFVKRGALGLFWLREGRQLSDPTEQRVMGVLSGGAVLREVACSALVGWSWSPRQGVPGLWHPRRPGSQLEGAWKASNSGC